MKSITSLIVLSAVSVLAVPVSVSQSASASVASVVDPTKLEAAWAKMKIELPDGVFPEDVSMAQRLQHTSDEQIIPMIVMNDNDFPSPPSKRPLYKHERTKIKDDEPGYRHLGAAASESSFDPVIVAPLSPNEQAEVNEQNEAEQEAEEESDSTVVGTGIHYKNFVALSDDGVYQHIKLPVVKESSLPETREVEEEVLPQGVSEKKVVGMDKTGRMKFVDVPYYNRGASSSSN